jgi:hypothetical protein
VLGFFKVLKSSAASLDSFDHFGTFLNFWQNESNES